MSTLLTILILIASVLMIGIVLIQKSKGGGLASNFASSNQIMGVRKTTDVVEKTTWTIAVIIMVLCIATVAFMPKADTQTSVVEGQTQEIPTANFETEALPMEAAPAEEAPATETPEN
ncbi:MAG: preprotein translocase subunit SecG [Bacteroidaceae bacterium]|nr:preprotein translocase subunit SecG [Bacteroidaceae bacterium]MBQ2979530.1 preprotein translocase subunit SecG [Bacteroidaceae bacterium]